MVATTAGPFQDEFYHPYAASLQTISERSEDGTSSFFVKFFQILTILARSYASNHQREREREWRASHSDRPDSGVFSPVCLRPLSDCSTVSALTAPP